MEYHLKMPFGIGDAVWVPRKGYMTIESACICKGAGYLRTHDNDAIECPVCRGRKTLKQTKPCFYPFRRIVEGLEIYIDSDGQHVIGVDFEHVDDLIEYHTGIEDVYTTEEACAAFCDKRNKG